jgi:2-iminobutanoate/2-iminopropanoate deaminase
MARRAIVEGSDVARPLGPFSRAVWCGDLLFVSGQTGVDPTTNKLVAGGVKSETHQILRNLSAVLAVGLMDFGNVKKVDIFVTDMADFGQVNEIYASAFAQPWPARTTVGVAALPGGACIEMALIAALS